MKKILFTVCTSVLVGITLLSFSTSKTYKCLVKMNNYSGEGAYIITSLINPDGAYEQTLYVNGDDADWYNEITNWWDFYGKRRVSLDAITGETIRGGMQKTIVFSVPEGKLNNGYKIRFETAVEDDDYHTTDAEIEFNEENLVKKIFGTGFIESIRIMPQL